MRNAVLVLLAGALLAACGQRGALYLPDEPREKVGTATPVASPLPAATPASSPTSSDDDETNARRRN